jgi:thiamine biosynthesis protein ThiS
VSTLEIQLNGEPYPIESGSTITTLLATLGRHPSTVAVELNAEILRRASFPETTLQAGDQVEIVHFVQGGVDLPTSPSV